MSSSDASALSSIADANKRVSRCATLTHQFFRTSETTVTWLQRSRATLLQNRQRSILGHCSRTSISTESFRSGCSHSRISIRPISMLAMWCSWLDLQRVASRTCSATICRPSPALKAIALLSSTTTSTSWPMKTSALTLSWSTLKTCSLTKSWGIRNICFQTKTKRLQRCWKSQPSSTISSF